MILAKRRTLLDAIYAIHAGGGLIRVDEQLVKNLTIAWSEYDTAIQAQAADEAGDLLMLAWGVIANAGHGNWGLETLEWQEAAGLWRDKWHAYLNRAIAPSVEAMQREAR